MYGRKRELIMKKVKVTRVEVKRPVLSEYVWVVTSRNYKDGRLPQAKKHRALEVFEDHDSAMEYILLCGPVFDYNEISASTPEDFLTKYF